MESRAVWQEILAVYAVKVSADPDNAQDVAIVTEEKKEILKDVFWDMNEITHSKSGEYNKLYRVQLPHITPHVCRHTFCTNMAKSGMNP